MSDQEDELFTISMVSCVPEHLENRIREYTVPLPLSSAVKVSNLGQMAEGPI